MIMIPRFVCVLLLIGASIAAPGCAGPGPKLFPPAPLREAPTQEGGTVRDYDLDGDRKPDFSETLSPQGRVVLLRYDPEGEESLANQARRAVTAADDRHLMIIVDSVPYSLVKDLYEQGRFRLFYPPARQVAPFPVMTDLSLAEFYGVSPCAGAESEFYDGGRLSDGYNLYTTERNTPWHRFMDYYMSTPAHAFTYLAPSSWYDRELRHIQDLFLARCRKEPAPGQPFSAYCVGPSALGAKHGRSGHAEGLIRLDRLCEQLMFDTRGKLQITLLSDHGHYLGRSRRIDLREYLAECGYRVTSRLERAGDVVVPEFSVVTYAGVYTANPPRVAGDAVQMEGVELAAYREAENVVMVLDRRGAARLHRRGKSYRYEPLRGDPLRLKNTMESLRRVNRLTSDDYAPDELLFEATCELPNPDAVHRLWRAFHGLMEHPPDVLLSIADGYHSGSALMSKLVRISATHGNLGQAGSYGFVMSSVGVLPPILRMESLRDELLKLGVPVPGQVPATSQPVAGESVSQGIVPAGAGRG